MVSDQLTVFCRDRLNYFHVATSDLETLCWDKNGFLRSLVLKLVQSGQLPNIDIPIGRKKQAEEEKKRHYLDKKQIENKQLGTTIDTVHACMHACIDR